MANDNDCIASEINSHIRWIDPETGKPLTSLSNTQRQRISHRVFGDIERWSEIPARIA